MGPLNPHRAMLKADFILQALDYDCVDKHDHMVLWYAAQVGNGPINDQSIKTLIPIIEWDRCIEVRIRCR